MGGLYLTGVSPGGIMDIDESFSSCIKVSTVPVCNLPVIENSVTSNCPDYRILAGGAECEITCADGYITNGSGTYKCSMNGKLSPTSSLKCSHPSWNCVEGTCDSIIDGSGTYRSLEECTSWCNVKPPEPPTPGPPTPGPPTPGPPTPGHGRGLTTFSNILIGVGVTCLVVFLFVLYIHHRYIKSKAVKSLTM